MIKKYTQRYQQLEQEVADVLATKYTAKSGSEHVNQNKFIEWTVKAKNLIYHSCGKNSEHYKYFSEGEKPERWERNISVCRRLKAIFKAAKDDFEGGYLTSIRTLVEAELFDNELDQARELLKSGYKVAGAVIAGVVLETRIKDLCSKNGIPHGKLDKMNADLAKIGLYNKLELKRVTALADIRNSAAHGDSNKFTEEDVRALIKEVEQFILNYSC